MLKKPKSFLKIEIWLIIKKDRKIVVNHKFGLLSQKQIIEESPMPEHLTPEVVLPKPAPHATELKIKGTDQLHAELVRSRVVESLATEVAKSKLDQAAFEFSLIIKW